MTKQFKTELIKTKEITENFEGEEHKFFITFSKRIYLNGTGVIVPRINRETMSIAQMYQLQKENSVLQLEIKKLREQLTT